MRVSDDQVSRTLAALRAAVTAVDGAGGDDGEVAAVEHRRADDYVATEVFVLVREAARVRAAEVARVRARLRAGEPPTAEDVATKLIGRLVCDRLR